MEQISDTILLEDDMMKKNLFIRIISTILFALIVYYFMLPPINLHAFSFYAYLILVAIFYLTISVPSLFVSVFTNRRHLHVESKTIKYGFLAILLIIPVILLVNFVLSPIFNSKAYYSRITISESEDFTNDIVLSKNTFYKLVKHELGLKNKMVRVANDAVRYCFVNKST